MATKNRDKVESELSKLNVEIEKLEEKLTKKLAAGDFDAAGEIEANLDHLRRAVGHRRRHVRLALEAVHNKERERLSGEIAELTSKLAGLADQSIVSERAIATLRTMDHCLTMRSGGSGAGLQSWLPGEKYTHVWSGAAEEHLPEKVKELCETLGVILKNPVDFKAGKNIRRLTSVLEAKKRALNVEKNEIGVVNDEAETDQ